MSSLYKEQFCTEVFIAVLLVYLAKTLQYVVLMVVFSFSVPLEGSGTDGYSHRHRPIKLIYIIIVIQHSSFIVLVLISTNLVF